MPAFEFTFAISDESLIWPALHVSHTIHRGFVLGVNDLLFEHDSCLYFTVWKGVGRLHPGNPEQPRKHTLSRAGFPLHHGSASHLKITTKEAYEARFGGFHFFMCGMKRTGYRAFTGPSREGVQRRLEKIGSAEEVRREIFDSFPLTIPEITCAGKRFPPTG